MSGTAPDWLTPLTEAVEQHLGLGCTVVVAVSGGGDSVALLHGLTYLKERHDLRLVVAHLDHGLRPESAEEAAFVGQLALDLGLFCVRERREVASPPSGGNVEARARAERYAFLEEVARAVGADAILTAHTQDDQAETVLMNLLRGAGRDGLTGMSQFGPSSAPGARTRLLRPLLDMERHVLREWLEEQGLSWREDPTNVDTTRQRAYLRHDLLPQLAERFPGVRQRLARSAALLADEQRWIEEAVDKLWQQLAQPGETGIGLVRDEFLAQPLAIQRHLLRRAVLELAPAGTSLSFQQVAAALALAERGHSGQRAAVPGDLFLHIAGERLWLGPMPAPATFPTLQVLLTLPGEGRVAAPGVEVEVSAVGREALPDDWADLPPTYALLDAGSVQWPLTVRRPQGGERWQPLGMAGQEVSLESWLASHGVPAHLRDQVTLLVDAEGVILWVVGLQVGHYARVRPESDRLWRIALHAAPTLTAPDAPHAERMP